MLYFYWLVSVEDPDVVIDYMSDKFYECGSKVFAFDTWWIVQDYAPDSNISVWEIENEY